MALQTSGDYIEIMGDLAQIVERRVIRQVRTQDIMANIESGTPVTLPTIGRTQVFAHLDTRDTRNKKLFMLTEIPAGIKNITKNLQDRRSARRYRLAMPHTYIWFVGATSGAIDGAWVIDDYRAFHARQRYNGMNDQFIVARLPNLSSDGRICWGATGVNPDMTLADRIDTLTNQWYLSRFNADLDGNVPLPYGEENFGRWVRESAEDINSWQRWPEWNDTTRKYSVSALLAEHDIVPRTTQITMPNAIPDVPIQMTFGRWEDWWRQLPTDQRGRAQISLQNLGLDDPLNIVMPPDEDYEDSISENDGGIEVEYVR